MMAIMKNSKAKRNMFGPSVRDFGSSGMATKTSPDPEKGNGPYAQAHECPVRPEDVGRTCYAKRGEIDAAQGLPGVARTKLVSPTRKRGSPRLHVKLITSPQAKATLACGSG
jgi:hypothetical protein